MTALGKADEKNTGKMGKILEKLMKKYWKNAKKLEKFMKKYWKNAKKTGKVREIRQSKKVGTMIEHLLKYLLQCSEKICEYFDRKGQ